MSRIEKTKLLITGAAGRLGSILIEPLQRRYELVLSDNLPLSTPSACPFIQADISLLEEIRPLFCDIDVVIHLAANPRPQAPWQNLLPNNIIGAANMFQAASESQCKRVIFASSFHAVRGNSANKIISENSPYQPENLYGASKAWGEILARYYSDSQAMSCLCLRLGWVLQRDQIKSHRQNSHFHYILTCDDLVKFIIAAIEAPLTLRYGIYHGISMKRSRNVDMRLTHKELGFEPDDDISKIAEIESAGQRFSIPRKLMRYFGKLKNLVFSFLTLGIVCIPS